MGTDCVGSEVGRTKPEEEKWRDNELDSTYCPECGWSRRVSVSRRGTSPGSSRPAKSRLLRAIVGLLLPELVLEVLLECWTCVSAYGQRNMRATGLRLRLAMSR